MPIRIMALLSLLNWPIFLWGNLAEGADWLVPSQISTIQGAIDLAAPGDQIIVSPGLYLENIDFLGKDLTLISSAGPSETIIDGSMATQGPEMRSTVLFNSGETALATLDGFTIQGGSGTPVTDAIGTFLRGGGIHISIASPTITNCRIVDNSSDFGSGLYAGGTLSLQLHGIEFLSNSGLEGSAAYLLDCGNVSIDQCQFVGNQSLTAGGAISSNTCSSVNISNCQLSGNSALIGGAIYSRQCVVDFANNEVLSNEATLLGGGITLYQSTSTITNSRFDGNSANHGGGIGLDGGNLVVSSSVFSRNSAVTSGAAISSTINLVSVDVRRCTIAENTSTNGSPGIFFPPFSAGGASSTLTLSHSILWNPTGIEVDIPTIAQVDHCTVSSGYPGTVVLTADPVFSDPLIQDFSLASISPCIDAGDPLQYIDPDGTTPDLGAIFHDQRPAAVEDLICQINDPCTQDLILTWAPKVLPPDSIIVSIGTDPTQLTALAALPGTDTSFSLVPGFTGTVTICVEPVRGGMTPANGATCCEIEVSAPTPLIPISGLSCSYDPDTCMANLSWSNGAPYSLIDLIINGEILTLPGSINSAAFPLTPGPLHLISLVPQSTCGETLNASECELTCPIPETLFIRGDANGDSLQNLADVTTQLAYLYQNGPGSCLDAMDCNDDGQIDVSDPIFLLLFLFDGGSPLPAPGGSCGPDPLPEDFLPCQTGPNCP